jgi:hypothetical protein
MILLTHQKGEFIHIPEGNSGSARHCC